MKKKYITTVVKDGILLEFSFNSLPADEMIQKFTVLFYNRDTAVNEIIYCKLYMYIVGHIKKQKTLYIKKHQYFTCINDHSYHLFSV